MAKEKILVTGGLGYIGSHTVIELLRAGYQPVIVDNLSNSEAFILDRIERIAGERPSFYPLDLCGPAAVEQVFHQEKDIRLVIHFAAHKAVGESVQYPVKYFSNNLTSLLRVLEAMQEDGCRSLVFSSSATVYGEPDELPVREEAAFKKALSAYGSTKQMGEEILEKVAAAGKIQAIALRYFNPVGAHPSGLVGELPKGEPNNLMPLVAQAAAGRRPGLVIYGQDYRTLDGTAIRDYIHVVDLARAHVKACHLLLNTGIQPAFEVMNIGTGRGYSVLEVLQTFEQVNGIKVPYRFGARRPGDAEANFADPSKAAQRLDWRAHYVLEDMVRDTWRWEQALHKGLNGGE